MTSLQDMLVRSGSRALPGNPYESPKLLSEYLLFHYGTEEEILGGLPGPVEALGFPARCVTKLVATSALAADASALDIGCAVGGSAFELSRHCARVLGIDSSTAFIEAASALQGDGAISYAYVFEGKILQHAVARVPAASRRERVVFEVGDAASLRPDIGEFDVVLAANLICRLRDPAAFLRKLPALVKAGGQLVLTTPFTWLEQFTPLVNWLGGRSPNDIHSFDGLHARLAPHFELHYTTDLPFLIREHARKFQYGVALGSRWIRRV